MPFVKGQSGNTKGRPKKGTSLTELLVRELEKRSIKVKNEKGAIVKITGKAALSRALVRLAIEGNLDAIKFIYHVMGELPGLTLTDNENNPPLRVVYPENKLDDSIFKEDNIEIFNGKEEIKEIAEDVKSESNNPT